MRLYRNVDERVRPPYICHNKALLVAGINRDASWNASVFCIFLNSLTPNLDLRNFKNLVIPIGLLALAHHNIECTSIVQ